MMSHMSMEGSVSSGSRGDATQQGFDDMPRNDAVPPQIKRKRNLPGTPDPDAEVVALSPRTLMATNRFVCEICNKGFQRDQNLQLHRRGHNLPWKLRQRTSKELKKRVYICPEPGCVHNHPSRALGDLTGIKKHFCRKHGEKKWKCDRCSKRYAVQSDWKAHSKTCGTREYRCDCGTLFSRRDSFITHRAFCDALAEETTRATTGQQPQQQLFQSSQLPINMPLSSLPLPLPFPPPSPRRVGSTGFHNASSMATPLRLQEPNFNPFNPHHRQAEEASHWLHYPSNNTILPNNDLSSSARNSLRFSQAGPGPPPPSHFRRSSSSSSTTSTPLQPSAFSGSSAFLGYPPKTMDGSLDDAVNSTNRHNHNHSHSHSHSSSSNPFADAHSLEVMFGGMQDLTNGLHWQQQHLQQQQLQQQQFKVEPSASSFNYPMQQQTTTTNANTATAAAQMHSSLLLNEGTSIDGGGGAAAQMSATSLLQKAAQMGATDSLYKSFGFPSTDIGGGNSNPSRLASLSRSSGGFGLSSILNKTNSCMMANAGNSSRALEEAVHSLATVDATRLFESNPDQSFGSSVDLDQGSKGHMMRSRFPSFEPKFEPLATAATVATSSSSSSFFQGKSEEVLTRDFLGVGRAPPPHAGMHHTLNPRAGSAFFLHELANISSASASSSTPASLNHDHGAAAAAAAATTTHHQYYHHHHHQDSSTS